MLYRGRGLNQQEGRGSSLSGSGFWVTVERGKGRPAGIQSPQRGVRVVRIIHVPASSVSGDDILNELE